MRFQKQSVSQWVRTGCERQLGLSLYSDSELKHDNGSLGLPARQVRPGLQQMAAAGNEWQEAKNADLIVVYGDDAVLGTQSGTPTVDSDGTLTSVQYVTSVLDVHLPGAAPGQFIAEAEFYLTDLFFDAFDLSLWPDSLGMKFSALRPDLIEVADADQLRPTIDWEGKLSDGQGDDRIRLRVVDMKLTSTPGPGNFAELAYYSVGLAAWLRDVGIDHTYAVSAEPAIWAGSHSVSAIRTGLADGIAGDELHALLADDLETAPLEVFIPFLRKLLVETLPEVAAKAAESEWQDTLGWHVQSSCSGCDFLGQSFAVQPPAPGSASEALPNHCVPEADRIGHLSQLAFVSIGGTRALRQANKATVADVAGTPAEDGVYDEHHNLRAGREILPQRAAALTGLRTAGLGAGTASTSAIPKSSDLSLYLTADFDQSSAITLAFGLSGVFIPSQFGAGNGRKPEQVQARTFLVKERNIEAERWQLELLLTLIDKAMDEAMDIDPEATVQIYVWDRLTYEHLVRVVGRHLGWLLASEHVTKLAWLFPPNDQIMESPRSASAPFISVVGDAIRGLVSTDQPHSYTLLGTARRYHTADFNPDWINTPPYWTTQFSDQIPSERAFDLWSDNTRIPYADQVASLTRTVKAKLTSLTEVTRRLRDDVGRENLRRKAPRISQLQPPGFVSGSSMLGSILHAHSKLDAAVDAAETFHNRSLAVHEREAKFVCIVGEAPFSGPERYELLTNLGMDPADESLRAYRTSPTSAESKLKEGDFLAAISPADSHGLLDQSLYAAFKDRPSPAWLDQWLKTFADVLKVEIVAFDRHKHHVVCRLGNLTAVNDLQRQGMVDLHGRVVFDQTSADFKSKKIMEAVQAIGNPPKAVFQANAIRDALGVTTRGPNTRQDLCPTEDLLWEPAALEAATVSRDAAALKAHVQAGFTARGQFDLNDDQWAAFTHALTRRLTLIWGPPGTGKSQTLGAILDAYMHDSHSRRTGENILLTAFTWSAIDGVAEKLIARNPTADIFYVSSGNPPSWAAGHHISTSDPMDMEALADQLAGDQPIVVVSSCQQTQKIVHACTQLHNGEESAAAEIFDVIAVDEAGQLDVGHSVIAFAAAKAEAQVLIAGDPLQLAPIHQAEPPEHLIGHVGPIYNYFRHLHDVPDCTLTINYRSNEEIVTLARHAGYPDSYTAHQPDLRLPDGGAVPMPPPNWPDSLQWDDLYAAITSPELPIVCITYPEGIAGQWNTFEATLTEGIIAGLQHHLAAHLDNVSDEWMWEHGIGVVTPHRAQRSLLSTRLQATRDGDLGPTIDRAVDTVERFQGQERDAIVASFAVGDPDTVADEAEFIQNLNRFNVLATRAKSKLVVIVSDEVVDHIASDLTVIRSSKLLKSFASTYCHNTVPLAAVHTADDGSVNHVNLTVRYP